MPRTRISLFAIGVGLLAGCTPKAEGVGFVLTEGFAVDAVRRVGERTFEVAYRFDYRGPERLCFLALVGTEVPRTPAAILLDADGSVLRSIGPPSIIMAIAPDVGEPSYVEMTLEPGDSWESKLEIEVPDNDAREVFFDLGIVSQINGVGLQVSCDETLLEPRTDEFEPRFPLEAR